MCVVGVYIYAYLFMYIYIFLITTGLVKNLRKLLMIDETTKGGTMKAFAFR